jgi:rhodanese-related sulfurtransferase
MKLSAFYDLLMIYLLPVGPETWDRILGAIRKQFPTVKQLSTRELADWLEDGKRKGPFLVDARKQAEFEVSHLKGAEHLMNVEQVRSRLQAKNEPVVVYCSAGYRSSRLAEKLQKAGYTRVHNLEGSIFRWANEGRPVYLGDEILEPARVHPFSGKWGQLLEARFRAKKES